MVVTAAVTHSGRRLPCALAPQSQITEDFRALRKTAEAMNLFKSNHLFFLLLLAHIIVMESIAWFTIFYFGNGWIPTIIMSFVLATSQVRPDTLTCRSKPLTPPARRGLAPVCRRWEGIWPSLPRSRLDGCSMITATSLSTRSPLGTMSSTSSSLAT